jgi:minor extracellular protease Epr
MERKKTRKSLSIGLCFLLLFGVSPVTLASTAKTWKGLSFNAQHSNVSLKVNVGLDVGTDPDRVASQAGAQVERYGPLNFVTLAFSPEKNLQNELKRLKKMPGVLSADRVRLAKALTGQVSGVSVTDPSFSTQWAMTQANISRAWDLGATGVGTKIAIVDTGVDLNHPDLKNNILPGYNAITKSEAIGAAQDNEGHGTHVSGIAAAQLNGIGIVGVAYQAKIIPVKVLDSNGFGSDDVIADGIIWAANHGANIINLSLGTDGFSAIVAQAIQFAVSKGALIIAAAGNFDPNLETNPGILYPASDPNVISVTATDSSDSIAKFSSTGSQALLAAPGQNILSDFWSSSGSSYAVGDGTSMAAPFVSGVAALVWSLHPDWNVRQIKIALENSVKDLGATGRDSQYGFGRIDGYLAVANSAPQTTVQSPADISSVGGMIQGGDPSNLSTLTIPPGAFSVNQNAKITGISGQADLPSGVVSAGGPVYVTWASGEVPKQILSLTMNSQVSQSGMEGNIYRWTGDRWSMVGGGTSSTAVSCNIFKQGIYRLGYTPTNQNPRLFGNDRIKTAIEISKNAYPTGAETVVIARSDDFPDALAGAPLAYKENAPILITDPNYLSAELWNELVRLAPKKILILGGPGAVSTVLEGQFRGLAAVERIWGNDRYSTATAIARALGTTGQAVVANGENFPDALSMAAIAAQSGAPILLTPSNNLPDVTAQALRQLSVTDTIIVGGSGVVSDQIASSIPNAIRLAGNDRYATAAAILQVFPPQGEQVFVATGQNFPDALTGGVLAASRNSTIVLVPESGPTTVEWQVLNGWHRKRVIALGGPGIVSDYVLNNIQSQIK